MAMHQTLLFVYARAGDIILGADGRATTSTGAFHSDSAKKLVITGPNSACAIGGYCEGTSHDGPHQGRHWRLLDALEAIHHLVGLSPISRARFLFETAYKSAAEFLPHDTDAGEEGTHTTGITVVHAELRKNGVFIYRADMPMTVTKGARFRWSVDRPVVRSISTGPIVEPFVYLHYPERRVPLSLAPPTDEIALRGLEQFIGSLGVTDRPDAVGGDVSGIRIDGAGSRWLTTRTGHLS